MSATLPLIAGFEPQAVLAWRGAQALRQGEFVAQAQSLARTLPPAPQLINLCEDRYRFMLGFAAGVLRGSVNLMPPSGAPAAIETLRAQYPQACTLTDADVAIADAGCATRVPEIPAEQVVAIAFTSGSTGASQAHAKQWRTLVRTAQLAAERFLDAQPVHIVGTVPAQHMYGLETTVLMALAAGCTVHAARPFFPQDVARVLGEIPAPRLLITTPVHLRALVTAQAALPALHLVISATAPLAPALAQQAEALTGAPLHEIYGCTEAGSLASRRTVADPTWRLYPGTHLQARDAVVELCADHLPERIPIADRIEILEPGAFRLLGRGADLLKVAGKRASLSDLTQKLLGIAGVEDAVVFLPDDGPTARPAALVVAPGLSEAEILDALARLVDPVFLPRPLKRVDALPRNEVGKLPRARLLTALRTPP